MRKFWIVLGHTYFSKVKSKAFIITTSIFLVFILAGANIDKIIDLFSGSDSKEEVAVIDQSDALFAPLEEMLGEAEDSIQLQQVTISEDAAKEQVQDGEFDGLLVLTLDEAEEAVATFYENDAAESGTQMMLEQQLQQLKVALATEKAGIDEATLASIYAEVNFDKIALDETTKSEEELRGARGIVYVMLFLLYMSVLMYGQMIATEVATEKSSRVMEILISSASPITHMFAKIIGIGLLGLSQIVLLIAVGYGMITTKLKNHSGEFFDVFGFDSTSVSIYFYAIMFFLLGYLLYATLSAMLGSLVSKVEDVQQLIMPVIFLIVIAFIIAMVGLNIPDATFITVTSFIPFFSPMIMFLRVSMLDVPLWQLLLSVGILVGTIYVLAIVGARIYRGGVLMYGASRSFKDIKNALLLSKKE